MLSLSAALARADAVVLIYHRFGESRLPSTNVTLAQFDAHLEHLARERYQVWPLERIVTTLQAGEALPDKVVAITIDDAFLSVYTGAYPRLKARGWPFTVFVNTDFIDRGLQGYMTWDQLREMQAHGMRAANHGASHERVWRGAGESEDAWRERVRGDAGRAQARLQAELGPDTNEAPRLYAYPYGEFDAATAELITQMRYVAFGQHSGAIVRLDGPDASALPRFAMAERYAETAEFAQKVAMRALPVVRVEAGDPRQRSQDPPRLELEFDAAGWRERLTCYHAGKRLPLDWRSDRVVRTRAREALEAGRNRYNCTARDPEGRWYWYSQPFIK